MFVKKLGRWESLCCVSYGIFQPGIVCFLMNRLRCLTRQTMIKIAFVHHKNWEQAVHVRSRVEEMTIRNWSLNSLRSRKEILYLLILPPRGENHNESCFIYSHGYYSFYLIESHQGNFEFLADYFATLWRRYHEE